MDAFAAFRRALVACAVAAAFAGLPADRAGACGRDSDCTVGARSYRIALPKNAGAEGSLAAILFVHGYHGTAAGVMRNAALTGLASELGGAFIAAQAAGPEWNLPGVPTADALGELDELAYFDALAADAAERFGIDRARTVVAGFSSGAMMVWYLACYRGDSYAGFVPLSGTFWAPIPKRCPTGPANLIHYHGTEDPMVPLHGRPIKDAQQGDVVEAFEMMAESGDYRPVEAAPAPGLDCTRRATPDGRVLELCLFSGKHEFRTRHILRAVRSFAGAP